MIFDFDGTLCDSGSWFLANADHFADRYGFDRVAPDELPMLRKMTSKQVIARLRVPRWRMPFIARYVRTLFGKHSNQLRLFDGIPELLAGIEAMGIKLAIVTSNSEANARAVLGPEIAARFSWWACGASLFGKAPKFRAVLRDSGFSADQTVSLGDETRDIDAARAVGIRAGAVLWGYAEPEAFAHLNPDLAFATPDDVLNFARQSHQTAPSPMVSQMHR